MSFCTHGNYQGVPTCSFGCEKDMLPGECPAAPAAPLPGNFSQNIFAGNFLTQLQEIFVMAFYHIIHSYCLKIPKAFCKSRLSCAEIAFYHNVRQHTFSEICICRKFYI
jgi:hypothetical protein